MVADLDSQAQMKNRFKVLHKKVIPKSTTHPLPSAQDNLRSVPVPVAAETDRANEIFPAENEDEEN
ncbi:hypothetical protein T06_14898 [Trichinella sp. T6]|nr:hypothetical protein T06_14898 [Trichinella sp. T6]